MSPTSLLQRTTPVEARRSPIRGCQSPPAEAPATDALGETIPATVQGGCVRLPVSVTPVFVEPRS